MEVPAGATLADVWTQVRRSVQGLRNEERPLFSCDRVYAGPERALTGREEIAAFPPVSGG